VKKKFKLMLRAPHTHHTQQQTPAISHRHQPHHTIRLRHHHNMPTQETVPASVADVNAPTSPAKFRWIQVIELGYEENEGGNDAEEAPICFNCGAAAGEHSKLSKCAKCEVASYW
jgi:hypothetical protein